MENRTTSSVEGLRAYLAANGSCRAEAAEALAARLRDDNVLVERGRGRSGNAAALAIAGLYAASTGARVLLVASSEQDVAAIAAECGKLEKRADIRCAVLGRDAGAQTESISLGSIDAIASLTAAGALDVSGFGAVILSDIDAMSDAASAVMARRALGTATQGRRIMAFASDPGPSHRALVRDLAGSFDEAELGVGPTSALPRKAIRVDADDKPRLFAALVGKKPSAPIVVFCNLRDTAEAAAKRLRADGYRVDYVLGALPRKAAIHASVVSGERDVLVLTDEGAEGLPASWASTLVNWDLPLEADTYSGRLAHVDARAPGAMIIDFVCERYELGIAAAERATGSKVALEEPDRGAAGDRRSEDGGSAARSAQANRTDSRNGKAADDRDRRTARDQVKGGGREARKRGGPRDDGERYDGRNARSIQADIAAITGGASLKSPGPEGSGASDRSPAGNDGNPTGTKKRKRRGKKGQAPAQDAKAEIRPARSNAEAARGRDRDVKGSKGRTGARPIGRDGRRESDPYSISMEERLERYRARYGNASGPEGRNGGGRKQVPSRQAESRGGGADRPSRGGQVVARDGRGREEKGKAGNTDGRASSGSGSTAPAGGLLGALRGLFGGGKNPKP